MGEKRSRLVSHRLLRAVGMVVRERMMEAETTNEMGFGAVNEIPIQTKHGIILTTILAILAAVGESNGRC